jgi:hypothetical protein
MPAYSLTPMKIESTDKSADCENVIDSILEFDLFGSLQQDDDETFASITSVDYFPSHEGSADESSDWEVLSPQNGTTDYVTTLENKVSSSRIPLRHDEPGAEFVLEWVIDPEQLEYAMAQLSMQVHSLNGKQVNRPGQFVFALSSMKPRYL